MGSLRPPGPIDAALPLCDELGDKLLLVRHCVVELRRPDKVLELVFAGLAPVLLCDICLVE